MSIDSLENEANAKRNIIAVVNINKEEKLMIPIVKTSESCASNIFF
jgi:hypothetical protein